MPFDFAGCDESGCGCCRALHWNLHPNDAFSIRAMGRTVHRLAVSETWPAFTACFLFRGVLIWHQVYCSSCSFLPSHQLLPVNLIIAAQCVAVLALFNCICSLISCIVFIVWSSCNTHSLSLSLCADWLFNHGISFSWCAYGKQIFIAFYLIILFSILRWTSLFLCIIRFKHGFPIFDPTFLVFVACFWNALLWTWSFIWLLYEPTNKNEKEKKMILSMSQLRLRLCLN